MKSDADRKRDGRWWSLPSRGARVEIRKVAPYVHRLIGSLPSRGARVEISNMKKLL